MEDILITLVRECPWLYDSSRTDFRDIEKKENSWRKIAQELNLDVAEVKKKWKNLRSSFAREKRIKPSGSSGGKKREWMHMQSLSFLTGFVKEKKKTFSNFCLEEQDVDSVSAPLVELSLNLDSNTELEKMYSSRVLESSRDMESLRVLQSMPMASTSSYTPMASTSAFTPMASSCSYTPMASTSSFTPMASSSSFMPMASTSKRPQEEHFLIKKSKRMRMADSIAKSLEVTDQLLQRELQRESTNQLPQSFCEVLGQLFDKISDHRKIDVMIKLLSVVKDELNKEND